MSWSRFRWVRIITWGSLSQNPTNIKESIIKIVADDGGAIRRVYFQSDIKVILDWRIKDQKNNFGHENINARLAQGSVSLPKKNIRIVH
jgi:endo-1,4-beta-mannosidase